MFFKDMDRRVYKRILAEEADRHGAAIWAYCLMDNHVHLIVVPAEEDSLARTLGAVHWKYTRWINHREGWSGYLWQGRFASFPMDESYLVAAVRYVERNPVMAGLVSKAENYAWSSARAHVCAEKDPLLTSFFLTEQIPDWSAFLSDLEDDQHDRKIEQHIKDGLPLGGAEFVKRIEKYAGRVLIKQKPGRKPTIHSVTVTN